MKNQLFDRILELTELMYQSAQENQWQQVLIADDKRQEILNTAEFNSISTSDIGLGRINWLNNQILKLARDEQSYLTEKFTREKSGFSHCTSYLAHSKIVNNSPNTDSGFN